MKRTLQAGILAAALLAVSIPASAHRYDRLRDGHILRQLAYFGHAIGIATEYVVTRPLHWVASQNDLDVVMGHQVNIGEDGKYFEWTQGSWGPTIAQERQARAKAPQKMVK